MKLKKTVLLVLIGGYLFISNTGCRKDKDSKMSPCYDVPSSGLCQAYFTSWFYNKEKNACEEIGYSGCSPKGFQNKADCEKCKCKN